MTPTERLRFAPSPTGDLHVGGARAALFNWLYARKVGGQFLLRIEDTDTERSNEASLQSILGSLRWLGLDWDGDLVFQSQRNDLYRAAVDRLIASGAAYRCFCTKEELDIERAESEARKDNQYRYSGRCRALDEAQIAANLAAGREYTVRFHVEPGESSFEDMVHGVTTFQNDTIGDFIIARADGSPVYLLGVAVDDADMGITLVMRGDDHISNTPKQIMLMRALGAPIPRFAHLPQVLGADKKKLSKRHGAASVLEYQRLGFLPAAVVNFLALLGWNPGDDREKMDLPELIQAFSIENIAKKSGVFDLQKLEWLNGQYLAGMSSQDLLDLASPLFVEQGLVTEGDVTARKEYILAVIELIKGRCRLVTDLAPMAGYFFFEPEEYDPAGARKYFRPESLPILESIAFLFAGIDTFEPSLLEAKVRELSENVGCSGGAIIHPVRLAVTGVTNGPGLFDLLALVGKDRVLSRIHQAEQYIRDQAAAVQ